MDKPLTTGQVAKILNVSPKTVSLWFDCGRLVGYRLPNPRRPDTTGAGDRRVLKSELIAFLKREMMPIPPSLTEDTHIYAEVKTDELGEYIEARDRRWRPSHQ